jgi:hypothetical protein
MVFPAGDQPSAVVQPTECPLDAISSFVPPERAAILQGWLLSIPAVWADEFDSARLKMFSQPVGIGSLVIQQTPGLAVRRALVHQSLDRGHFAMIGSGGVRRERRAVAISQQENAGSASTMTTSHVVTPFFARENEPSPIASSQSMPLRCSSLLSSRSQAARKTPQRVQSRCRRQQVTGEGYRSGKSFQRAPVISTQRTPSKHSRDERQGRPPRGLTGGSGNRSAIRSHCASERKGFGAVLDPVLFGRRFAGQSDRVMSMCVSFHPAHRQTPCQSCSVSQRL